MQVLHRAVAVSPQAIGMIVHVQSVVCVMVMIRILTVHHQVLQFAGLLGDGNRAEHTQRLPKQHSQKEKRVRVANHCIDFMGLRNPRIPGGTGAYC